MNHNIKLVTFFLFISLFFCGCSKNEELISFEENMTLFHQNIYEIGSSIETIDPNSPDAVSIMNNSLENMLQQFQFLASIDIPSQFASIETLADDAFAYMQEAVRLYSEAYEDDYVSDSFIQAASENYESAMKRVSYIATILQGEIPEGARIIESNDNEFEPYSE